MKFPITEVAKIDAAIVKELHSSYYSEGASDRYVSAVRRFITAERRIFPDSIRLDVESILGEGKIPLFRSVLGDWIEPRNQFAFEIPKVEQVVNDLMKTGLSRREALIRSQAYFRGETVSTSLSLVASLEIAATKRDQNHRPLRVAVIAWDGSKPQGGADAMEFHIDPLEMNVKRVYEIPETQMKEIDQISQSSNTREIIYPLLKNYLGFFVQLQSSTH